jgi:hypothetical protein
MFQPALRNLRRRRAGSGTGATGVGAIWVLNAPLPS